MNFESRFSQPSSINNPNSSSLISNSYGHKEPTLDYFNDSRNNEKPSFTPVPEKSQVIKSVRPSANWTFDDQKNLREQKREEWRKSLLEQVQEKERIKQEEKNKRLLEDKKLEERLGQERELLENKYKREIQAELGLPYEEAPIRRFKEFEPQKPVFKQKEKPSEGPRPIVKEIEQTSLPKFKAQNLEFNPMKIEYWKSRSDLEVQHNSFKNILTKLKQDADQAHLERNEAMMELDRFREQLRMSNMDKDLQFQQRHIFQRNYSSSLPNAYKPKQSPIMMQEDYFSVNRSMKENQSQYYQPIKSKRNKEDLSEGKQLNYESKFVPLVNAGHSVIGNSSSSKHYADHELENVKDQLIELDQLLSSYE